METALRLRPMGVIDQIDFSLRVYRRNFVVLFGINALLQAPYLVIQLVLTMFTMGPMLALTQTPGAFSTMTPEEMSAFWINYFGSFGLIMLFALVVGMPLSALSSGATIYAASRAYMQQPVEIMEAYRFMWNGRRFFNLIVTALLMTLALLPLSLLSIIPCLGLIIGVPPLVYISLRWATSFQISLLEDVGPVETLRRAWRLNHKHLLRLFGLLLLAFGLAYVLVIAFSGMVGFIASIAVLTLGVPYMVQVLLQSVTSSVFSLVITPLSLVALTVFYYDLRIRKEGYDLYQQAAEVPAQA